jgi:tyrosine-protein phosphatase non-receptor type 23
MVSILYNIGALHTQLGASDSRVSAEGMKLSCTHFQCAAWAFQVFFPAAFSFNEKFLMNNM